MFIQFLKYIIKEFLAFIVRLFGALYLLKFLCRKQEVYFVFNYHNFSKFNNYKIIRGDILETGFSKQFEKQLKFLKKNFGFKYPDEFFKQSSKGISILITFDDGYKDNHDIALPILKKHNAKAIFFVVSKFINSNDFLLHDKVRYLVQNKLLKENYADLPLQMYKGRNDYSEKMIAKINQLFKYKKLPRRMMNYNEINEIINSGFIIGNHSHSHRGLSFLDYDSQEEEILKCQNVLSKFGIINTIAYPNGLSNTQTYLILKELGIEYGFSIIPGWNNKNQDVLKIKRIGLNASDSLNVVLLKMLANYFNIKWI